MPDEPRPSPPARLRLALACRLSEVRPNARQVQQFLAANGCATNDLMDCELALVEACNNAIQYSRESATNEPILIEAICSLEEIELRITDHSASFEWSDQLALPDPRSESGRGLFLIRSLMQESYYHKSSHSNVMVLRKKRSG